MLDGAISRVVEGSFGASVRLMFLKRYVEAFGAVAKVFW